MKYRTGMLIISLGVAFFLRVWGLDFGLPYEFHPDEQYYIDTALSWHIDGVVESGLNPSLFERLPFKYTLIAGYGYWFLLSPYTPTEQWLSAAWFFARFWSVVFGVLTVALAYPVGKRLYGVQGGLMATIIITGLFLPVRESHFAVNDAAVTFFTLLSIYLSVLLFWRRRLRNLLTATVVVALTAATKLTGWFTGVALFAAYVMSLGSWGNALTTDAVKKIDWRKELKYVGLICLTMVGMLVIISVRSLKELLNFMSSLVNLFRIILFFYASSFKGIQIAPVSGWQFYINVLGWGIGWLLLGVIIWAIGAVCWRRYYPGIVIVIFSLVFFGYIGSRQFLFARFILPIIPPLIILTTGELSRIKGHQFIKAQYRSTFFVGITMLLLLQPLSTSIWSNYLLTLPDTRVEATNWIMEEFSPDTVIIKERYSIFPNTAFFNKRWESPFKIAQLNAYGATYNQADHYLTNKTDLIVISNFTSARSRQDADDETARLAQQSLLNQEAKLIKTFNPYRNAEYANGWFYLDELYNPAGETLFRKQPGPLIKIYRLPYKNQPYSLEEPSVSVPVKANFADKMLLLGYDMPVRRAEPGGTIPLTLYWQALSKMDKNYVIFNRLLDPQQQSWGGYDRWPQEISKTTLWQPGEILADTFNVPVAVDAPAGIYTIDIGLYDQDDLQATSLFLLQDGVPIDKNSVRLSPIKIGNPLPEVTTHRTPQHPLHVDFGDVIRLRGYDFTQKESDLSITFFWEALAPSDTDYTVFVHLRNDVDETVAQIDGPPVAGQYPTSLWDKDDVVVDSFTMDVSDIGPGNYKLVVGLYNPVTFVRPLVPDTVDNSVFLTDVEIE